MANIGHGKKFEAAKNKLLYSALKLFLENGFQATKITEITSLAKVDGNAVARVFGDKEMLVAELIEHILIVQFETAREMVKGKTEDDILFYATETVLQLYMAESSEHIREIYNMAYTCARSSSVIYDMITGKLERFLKKYLPDYDAKDFYELEIASGGIMRGFITVPCDRYFTMDRKIDKYLEYIFLLFRVPEEELKKAKEFVAQFDYSLAVGDVIAKLLAKLAPQN
ncbi:MAG: TetR/AcrR family transcriptional regulator [Clostridia bacterium]|nr:TetR/AcrR family transcriptional regulator [Clostridia bacterium]